MILFTNILTILVALSLKFNIFTFLVTKFRNKDNQYSQLFM